MAEPPKNPRHSDLARAAASGPRDRTKHAPEKPLSRPRGPLPPPDSNRVLSAAFAEAIKPFWVDPVVCPVCRKANWEIGYVSDVVQRYLPGKVLTFVPVRCTTCQHTILFNAVALGLFDEAGNPKGIDSLDNEAVEPPATPEPSET